MEHLLRERKRDERAGVERRIEQRRLENPDHGEPGLPQVHQDVAAHVVDLKDLRRLGAEHRLRVAVGDRAEEPSRREPDAEHVRQVPAGRFDPDPTGLRGGHKWRSVDTGVRDLVHGGVVVDVLHVVDHGQGRVREDLVVADERLAGGDGQQVGPERVDLGQEVGLG